MCGLTFWRNLDYAQNVLKEASLKLIGQAETDMEFMRQWKKQWDYFTTEGSMATLIGFIRWTHNVPVRRAFQKMPGMYPKLRPL